MTLCEADITSGDERKVKRYLKNFAIVRKKLREIEEKDRIRNFQPPISGELIMSTYGLTPCRTVGEIKEEIKDAILDGRIANDYDEAYALMEQIAAQRGLAKVIDR
jgi:poly(A) polymerase